MVYVDCIVAEFLNILSKASNDLSVKTESVPTPKLTKSKQGLLYYVHKHITYCLVSLWLFFSHHLSFTLGLFHSLVLTTFCLAEFPATYKTLKYVL